MESGVIVYAFLLAGFLTLCGVGLFIWVNSRQSDLDNRSYDQSFDPGKMVSKYKYSRSDTNDFDPTKKLKRYARPSKDAASKNAELDRLLEEGLDEDENGDNNKVELPPDPLEEVEGNQSSEIEPEKIFAPEEKKE